MLDIVSSLNIRSDDIGNCKRITKKLNLGISPYW